MSNIYKNIPTSILILTLLFLNLGLDELCGTELNLECEDGKWPRLFKGSACEDIFTEVSEDTVLFPTYQELENPCTGAVRSFII